MSAASQGKGYGIIALHCAACHEHSMLDLSALDTEVSHSLLDPACKFLQLPLVAQQSLTHLDALSLDSEP